MSETALINLDDYRRLAEEKLSRSAFDYYASGAHDQVTLKRNRKAFEELSLYYKVLVDVSRREFSTSLFGRDISLPVVVATSMGKGYTAGGVTDWILDDFDTPNPLQIGK